ncbi:MAG: DUF4279 domain-containing protein [Cocleimonas sp.]
MALNEAVISFTMAGYGFNPDDITEIVGLEPTTIINGNSRQGENNPVISSWEFSSAKSVDDDIDVYYMTRMLIKQIEPAKDNIITAIERYSLVPKILIKLVISKDEDEAIPDIGISTRNIRFLAELGAFVNVDIKKR